MRLFCFPFAGGTASAFFGWKAALPAGIEVRPVEYPGRGSRWHEPAGATLDARVDRLADELRPLLDRPYALFGHSFGALIAFEVAKRLRRADAPPPVRLFASAARAPHVPARERCIGGLPDPEFLAQLVGYGGVPEEVLRSPELLALTLPVVREDFRLFEDYRYPGDGPLPVPITALGGLRDDKVRAEDLLAWSRHTTKSFRVQFFAGHHFFLNDQRAEVQRAVCADLAAAPAGRDSAGWRALDGAG